MTLKGLSPGLELRVWRLGFGVRVDFRNRPAGGRIGSSTLTMPA